ncbi:MAG TPA: SH3 domain-containing protein [Thermoanaerobaculia bacterium]
MKRFVIAAALLLAALPVLAQEAPEDEEPSPEPILAHVSKAANLHTSPGGPAKGVVKSGEEVDVVGTTNGWMRVRESDKTTGWVDRRMLTPEDAEVDLSPKKFVRKASTKKGPCFADLEHCPTVGCAAGEDNKSINHALMNTLKHGPGNEPAASMKIASFLALQKKADDLVGQGASLTPEDRDMISNLKVGSGTTGEGHQVVVTGYLVGDPHPNSGESVNCNLSGKDNNDMHIPFADSADKTPFEAIVIETIPQGRNAGWTRARMMKVLKAKQRVMITGQLFYDSAHRVRTNDNPSLKNQPQRFSLWEIHPVNEFLVCAKSKCSPNDKTQWTKVEDME